MSNSTHSNSDSGQQSPRLAAIEPASFVSLLSLQPTSMLPSSAMVKSEEVTEEDRDLMRELFDHNKENIDPLANSRPLTSSKKKAVANKDKKLRKPKKKLQSAIDTFLSETIMNVVNSHCENDPCRLPLGRRSILVQGQRGAVRKPLAELPRACLHRL